MDSILSLMVINANYGILPHSAKIQETVEIYLNDVPNAVLISNDLSSWRDVTFPFPLETRSFESKAKSETNAAFIFDTREDEWSPNHLTPLRRNSDSKYMIITTGNNSESVSEAVLTIGLCFALMVAVESNDIKVFKLEDPCRGIGRDPEKGLSCKANASFFYYPPDITFSQNRLSGTEGRTLQTAADLLGIQLGYHRRNETDFGVFNPPYSGIYGDIGSGRSIAAIGGLMGYPYRLENANLLYSCGITQLIWAVPLHSAPMEPTWFVILVSELSPIVWICSFAIYLLLVPLSILFGCVTKKTAPWPFHILALVLGVPQRIILSRGLTMTVVVFGFLLTSYYQAIMGSKLTAPPKIPEITTLKQLADSNLRLLGVPVIGYFINLTAEASPDDLTKSKIRARFESESGSQDDLLPKIVLNRDFAYVRHRSAIYYHSRKVCSLFAPLYEFNFNFFF